MPAGLIATLVQAGTLLTLDASGAAPSCPDQLAGEVVVCARRDIPTTRLPMEMDGVAGTMLIEPSGPNRPLCNPDFVTRAGLQGRGPYTIANIGSIDAKAATADVSIRILGRTVRADADWTAEPSIRDADCVAGPRLLGYRTVRFVLGRAKDGARTATFPFARARSDRPYARVPVGKDEIAARFELTYPLSVLTAPAARIVAAAHGGTVDGPTRSEHIMYGIMRPIRQMAVRTPLPMGGVALSDLWVRVSDYGSAGGLRSLSPDEIEAGDIVAAARQDPPGRVRLLRVGRDALAGCGSITVDLRDRAFTLVC